MKHTRQPGLRCVVCGAEGLEPAFSAPDRLHGPSRGEQQVAICRSCHAGTTLPLQPEHALAAYYPEGYGPYEETRGRLERWISRQIRRFQAAMAFRTQPLKALRGRSHGRGLDVGCGRGDLAAALQARGWEMQGIEPSSVAAAAAADRGISMAGQTLAEARLETNALDFVVFRHSLEHLANPATGLREVRAPLAPGGLVLISVPNFGSWQARLFRGRWYHLDLPRHRAHFTKRALALTLKQAGYEVVSISTGTSAIGLPASIQYVLFGRCLFPSGLALRVAAGLCSLALPVTLVLDRLFGGGDTLHAIGVKPRRS